MKRKKHSYSGTAYDRQGQKKATWHANHLSHETGDIHAFTFTGQGELLSPNKKLRTVGQVVFQSRDPLRPKNLVTGYGSYYDYAHDVPGGSATEVRNDFNLYKLEEKDYVELIGKKKLETPEDEQQFIVRYYEKNSPESILAQ